MANRTASYATTVHGTNPQYLIEKITRTRIQESRYWKEHCTLLNSALVLEKAVDDLRYVGGTYGGNTKPTPFLCLTLKLLQIQPQKEILYLYIEQPDFKYLRALGAFYLRLVGKPAEIYNKLEPILRDYRKLRISDRDHKFSVIHMDELIDNLLHEERVFDVILPRMTKRIVLEENGDLEMYKSEVDLNLIPSQVIHEKVEKSDKEARRDTGHHSRDRHKDESCNDYSSRDRIDYRESHKRARYSGYDGRYKNRDGFTTNDAHYQKSATTDKIGRFRREDVENENNIRAKLGLKPLR